MQIIFNTLMSSILISVAIWLSRFHPILGGFIVSLPLSTLLVLAFSQFQNGDSNNSFLLAKSIFIGVPSSLLFFIPFLLAGRYKFSFWTSYGIGLILLFFAYFIHRWILTHWMD